MLFDVDTLIQSGGIILISLIVFAETGLLLGLLLPGDSLLIAAGLFAARGDLPLAGLIVLVTLAAIAGYHVGYWVGVKAGPRVFKRQDGLFFKQEYVSKTENFFKSHGGKTIIAARFVPYLRTLAPVVAGVGSMNRRSYNVYNLVGAVLWVPGLILASYWLGSNIPNIDKLIFIVLIGGLVIFHGGLFWHLLHNPHRRSQFKTGLREEWNYLFKSKSRRTKK
ncbi:DedA family protein [Candidatus Saccharibacteria bacterium]|nr:DedA family protein [Candidatus Saccharibacteria bacterium]